MSIRLPLLSVLDVTNTDVGTASVAGGIAYPFKLPQDTDNVVVKFSPSVVAGGTSAIFQTTDDGGTTWYDVCRTSIASNTVTGAQWMSVPTMAGPTTRASVVAVGSVIAVNTIGPAAASTLGTNQFSGLPVLGLANRMFLIETGTISANSTRIQVLVNNQSNHS